MNALMEKPEVAWAAVEYNNAYKIQQDDPENATLAGRYMASMFLKTKHRYQDQDVDAAIQAIEQFRKNGKPAQPTTALPPVQTEQPIQQPAVQQPTQNLGESAQNAEAEADAPAEHTPQAEKEAQALVDEAAEYALPENMPKSADPLKSKYVMWMKYDDKDRSHKKALVNFGGEAWNEETYIRTPLHENQNAKIEKFFEKHKRYQSGVTLRDGGSPGIAYRPKLDGVNVTRMSSVTKKKLKWLWKDRIPAGALSTIAGDPDCGKSLLSLYISACVTRGLPFYGTNEPTPRGEVLILSAEDDPENTLAPRLEAAGADLNKVHLLESVAVHGNNPGLGDRLAQLDQDINVIMNVLATNPTIRLIIIDPISSFLGNAHMHKEQEVRAVLNPLVTKARASNVTVIQIAHFNKNTETKSPMDRVGGAKALVGLGRAAWTCVREPEPENKPEGQIDQGERFLFLKLKNNLAPSRKGGLVYSIRTREVEVEGDNGPERVDVPFVQFVSDTQSTAQEVIIDNKRGAGRPNKVAGCVEWLKIYLAPKGGYAATAVILGDGNDEGYSDRTLYRAKEILQLSERRIGGIKHWGFLSSLPEGDVINKHGTEHGGVRPGSGRKAKNAVNLEQEATTH